jgi:hypothetical protein
MLWAIHELDRVDKHRLLLPVAVVLDRIDLDGDSYDLSVVRKFSGFGAAGPVVFEPLGWTPLKEGGEILGFPNGADFGVTQTTLNFDIRLAEPGMLRDESAVTQLRILAGLAGKVIRDLAPLA